jgi:transcriptional regulator with XRE-family HTH domain
MTSQTINTKLKIPEYLRFIRQRKNFRQIDIAKHLGISKALFSNYENGLNMRDPVMFQKWLDFLEVDLAALENQEETKAA